MLITDLDRFKASKIATTYPSTRRTFYAPYDDVHSVLCALLDECSTSLVMSMYGFTDKDLADRVNKLLTNPAIFCQITLDRSQYNGPTEKQVLADFRDDMESNVVAIGTSEKGQIIHRKMLIIDGIWTVTGSTNWSVNGETRQDNEMTVTYDPTVAAEARHIIDLSHAKALTDMARVKAHN